MSAPTAIPVTAEMLEGLKDSAEANAAHKLAIEDRARLVYLIFAGHAGDVPCWERLPEQQRIAWRGVVEFVDDNPECAACGERLLCLSCEASEVGDAIVNALRGTD